MIIRETEDSFLMIKQHDHAYVSGETIKHFNKNLLKSDDLFDDFVYAAHQHDRSWIGLDDTPIWNDGKQIPFTFSDYPLLPKLAFYKMGVDEVEKVNLYAALLCSLHFCSFFAKSKDPDCLRFLQDEARRQHEIRNQLTKLDEELLTQHFQLLQLSDNLSLYFCLNEPGVEKEYEHPWFKDGFKNTGNFHPRNQLLLSRWVNEHEVTFDVYPFETDFHVTLPYKKVDKMAIRKVGIAEAYGESRLEIHSIFIRK
ncbi:MULTISPECIES: DUF3891 family protein [Bacillaceae]|uniref:DUF3891 family protein n=1 Tax=Bacillaceae TaxID=186817 RepID=UPI001C59612A|nr:DUF3891 family protein [Rossellomorea sp. YZS02]MBW3112675.1 DUF3891 family protein [Bacillus sp. MCCB 382]MDX8342652.1 DUF3891 family protein [Rossellomorea sp. YZS02]